MGPRTRSNTTNTSANCSGHTRHTSPTHKRGPSNAGDQAPKCQKKHQVDPEELESAHWFERGFILGHAEDDTFRLPRRDSIARRLIEDWLRR